MSLFVIACATVIAQAQAVMTRFDIPAQPLADALRAVGRESSVNVLFDPSLVAGRYAPALKAEITTDEALSTLLAGTGITHEFLNEKTVVLAVGAASLSAAGANPPSPDLETTAAENGSSLSTSEDPVAAKQAANARNERTAEAMRLTQAGQNGPSQNTENPKARGSKDRSGASAAAGYNQLEEIVVTAQKREERLIDTPISIGVLSGDDFDRSSSRGVGDALAQVGGVSMVQQRPGGGEIAIRGILTAGGGTGGGQTTAYYQDEVPLGVFPDTSAFDLARVEVLRGPQGTLYGSSALGGVVRVLTNDARLDAFEVKGRARTSNTERGGNNYGGDLAVNVPLIDGTLAIRGVASYSNFSGFIDSTYAGGGGTKINDAQERSYRLKIGYQANDSLSFKVGLMRSSVNSGAPSTAFDDFTTSFSPRQFLDRVLNTYNLVTEYKWSSVSLLSSTSYVDSSSFGHLEFLIDGVNSLAYQDQPQSRAFSQEFRLASQLAGPWQWSAGAIYEDSTAKIVRCCFVPDFYGFFPQSSKGQSESTAVFGELRRSFDEGKFNLTAGLRYFKDRQVNTQYSTFFGPILNPLVTTGNFHKLTGRLLLDYKPRADSMFYGSVATGFRSGANQGIDIITVDPNFGPVRPDTLITYELGTKGRVLEGTLTYDLAVYYSTWKDIQQTVTLEQYGFTALLNTGKVTGPGVDLGLSYQLTQALALQASLGWNDITFAADNFSGGKLLFAKGSRLNESPEWTGSVGGRYAKTTPWAGTRAVLSGNLSYGSRRSFRYLNLGVPTQRQSDDMYNLRTTAGVEGDRWSVEIFGDNLLNDDGKVTGPSLDLDFTSVRQRPRTLGLQVSFNY